MRKKLNNNEWLKEKNRTHQWKIETLGKKTDLVCDLEINDSGFLEDLNCKGLARNDVLSKFDFAEIALTKSPSKLVFSQSHSLVTAIARVLLLVHLLLCTFSYHHHVMTRLLWFPWRKKKTCCCFLIFCLYI